MKNIEKLFNFIKGSPTAYHAIATVKRELSIEGYTELSMSDEWKLEDGKGYYVTRNESSIIAFRMNKNSSGYMIAAAHSDSPCFRVKTEAEKPGVYTRLNVEKYGGMIYYTWLDRPLSVAGRVLVKCGDGSVKEMLVDLERDLVTIPSVAVHLNRGVNDGAKFNPAVDLLPLFSKDGESGALIKLVAGKLGVSVDDVISHDLFVYNRDEGRVFGEKDEFILCPRLDDLGCVYAALEAFLGVKQPKSTPVLAVFDNEEVGSETKQGAASGFLYDVLVKASGSHTALIAELNNSFMVSADNAHAVHPAHPELSDSGNAPKLGNGIVIKYNASQRYTTDGLSDALFRTICKLADVNVQSYANRADLPGGSTLGSISNTRVAVSTVDIGLPQLAMHSANETAAVSDLDDMIKALTKLYSVSLEKNGNTYKLN